MIDLYFLIFQISVFVSSISQILLKKSANSTKKGLEEYLNFRVITAYALFFGATFLTTFAYKGVSLQIGPALEAAGYVYVMFLGHFLLDEKVSLKKIIGTATIIIGILVCCIKW